MIKTKPKTPEEFISSAKAEEKKPEEDIGLFAHKDKTFLIRMPLRLHELAKEKAGKERITLHDFILIAVKEKATE